MSDRQELPSLRRRSLVAIACMGGAMFTLFAGCAGHGGSAPMVQHFDAARDGHDAVVDGDLEGARRAGSVLAFRDPDSIPDAPDSLVDRIQEYAGQLASAATLVNAALSVAQIGGACGDCHRQMFSGPMLMEADAPSNESGELRGHMQQHDWAATRLWLGLIGPSDASWQAGARALTDAPMLPEHMTDRAWRTAADLEVRVHALGERASHMPDGEARALLYAEVLMSCGACHDSFRGPS